MPPLLLETDANDLKMHLQRVDVRQLKFAGVLNVRGGSPEPLSWQAGWLYKIEKCGSPDLVETAEIPAFNRNTRILVMAEIAIRRKLINNISKI